MDAGKFNAQSANTLLKIIEEPPEKTLFILVAEDDSQILTTILSRTVIIKCHKLKTDEIRQSLIRQYHCTEDAARNAAILSEGNYNLACKYLKMKTMRSSCFKLSKNGCVTVSKKPYRFSSISSPLT